MTIVACGDGSSASDAAVVDAPAAADAKTVDVTVPLTWVDFAVEGCPAFDPAGPACHGPAPLRPRSARSAPAEIDTWIWSFGDGTPDETGDVPEHEFVLPGSYTVSLAVGGPG